MTTPLFAINSPSFMGIGCDEDEDRFAPLRGERSCAIRFAALYVHGKLERQLGFDLATLLVGDVEDIDRQDVTVLDTDLNEHTAVLVSIKHRDVRYGLIVDSTEVDENAEYLRAQAKNNEHNERLYL